MEKRLNCWRGSGLHADFFQDKQLVATGTTGRLLNEALNKEVLCLASGPLGGDQQIGALIAEQKIDWLVFLLGSVVVSAS